MFSGIIEATGRLLHREERGESAGLQLSLPEEMAAELELGESLAVNGVCLTVTESGQGTARFDVLAETLRLTNLGDLSVGGLVNLERSLRVGDRVSGHFVSGHVDATAEVLEFSEHGEDSKLVIALPEEGRPLVAKKGSVCIDGTSLTVAEVESNDFTLWIIPHTRKVTRLHEVNAGDRINLEYDLLARYVQRLSETSS